MAACECGDSIPNLDAASIGSQNFCLECRDDGLLSARLVTVLNKESKPTAKDVIKINKSPTLENIVRFEWVILRKFDGLTVVKDEAVVDLKIRHNFSECVRKFKCDRYLLLHDAKTGNYTILGGLGEVPARKTRLQHLAEVRQAQSTSSEIQ